MDRKQRQCSAREMFKWEKYLQKGNKRPIQKNKQKKNKQKQTKTNLSKEREGQEKGPYIFAST